MALKGRLLKQEPLRKYTTWRVGGPARQLYFPADRDDLQQFLATLPAMEPVFWIGLGSNLLIRDGGIRGTVIYTRGRLKEMTMLEDELVYVEAGVPCAHVARFCADAGLAGAEFLVGIPGTMGGALKMNAGAFGSETWEFVESVDMVDAAGRTTVRGPDDFDIAYRSVPTPEREWFVAARLRLVKGSREAGLDRMRALLARRAKTQPTNQATCGSVFKNPPGSHAAKLIEEAGLKGVCIGGACVSEKHANFIVNTGTATAADIEALIAHVRTQVADREGIELQSEVCIVGERL